MNTRSITLAAALCAATLAGPAAAAEPEPFGRLDVAQVEALLGQPGLVIVDVNSAEVYARGHVPGAIWSSLADVEKKLPPGKDTRLVYYCHNAL